MKVLLVALNAKYIHSSLALYSIAANCRLHRREVEVKEYTINQELLHILGDIAGREPTVVGLACYIWNREMVLKLAAALRQVLPNVVIMIGGPEVFGDAAALLLENQAIDFVVQGEGEESVPELLDQIEQGADLIKVDGVALRQVGGVELNGGIRLVENLDSLPFPYQEETMAGMEHRIVYYESSRGCPYSCSYCISSMSRGVRVRSWGKVREELQFFLRHGVKQVKFIDRTFNVLPAHYQPIWDFLAEQEETTNFHFEIVADRLGAEEVRWLANVPQGRFQFEIGVQSTCTETLQAIGRHNEWEKLHRNIQQLNRAGNIHLHLDLIAGLPYEGWDEFRQSFNSVYGLTSPMGDDFE